MKLKRIRNALVVVLTLALVSAAAVAVTWALTNKKVDPVTNTFTEGDIEAELAEPWWDFLDENDHNIEKANMEGAEEYPKTAMDLGTSADPIKGETYAEKYYAGQFIPKNPKIYNTNASGGAAEYVAMTVDYKVRIPKNTANNTYVYYYNGTAYVPFSEGNLAYEDTPTGSTTTYLVYSIPYATFQQIADVNVDYATKKASSQTPTVPQFNTVANWIGGNNSPKWDSADTTKQNIFYYDTTVPAQGKTEPLFQFVRINPDITSASPTGIGCSEVTAQDTTKLTLAITVNHITNTTTGASENVTLYLTDLPAFDIELQGYAIEADNVAGSNDTDKLNNAKAALAGLIAAN